MRGAVFFGSRKRQKSAGGASPPGDPGSRDPGECSQETAERHSDRWDAWRLASQRVSRAWNEWLAADSRERPGLYQGYVCALVEEERAAVAIERAVSREATARDAREIASESEQELAS
jgi:hypothetical protein